MGKKSAGKRIGIMGGTFDPVHIGHLFIAEQARETFELNLVLFIPTGYPPHKQTSGGHWAAEGPHAGAGCSG